MNRSILIVLQSIVILFSVVHSITTKRVTSLELKIDKTVFLVDEIITVNVLINNLPSNESVKITVKGKSNKEADKLLQCLDCETKVFKNNRLVKQSNRLDGLSNNQFNSTNQHVIQFKWKAIEASKLTLFIETDLDENEIDKINAQFVEIGIIKSKTLSVIADIFGWLYFVSWLSCFYPQVWLNWKRKSCVGLNIDYCILNFVGFMFYGIFNFSVYFVPAVQAQYELKYPYSNIPVLTNDLVFSLHHLFISLIIWMQCMFIYDNGNQFLSKSCIVSLTIVFSGFFILGYYVLDGKFYLLDFIYYTGFVKMFFTALKYLPQAYSNYKIKSTQGWSVTFNVFDMIGGSTCLLQMFVLIRNYQDWSFISKNIAKTGIALLTLIFDVVFLIQHFYLYGNKSQSNKNKINYGSTQINMSLSSKQGDSSTILFKESNNNIS